MAIDTKDKRFSMMGLSGPAVWPVPDGTIDTLDRVQWLGLYRAAIGTVVPSVPDLWADDVQLTQAVSRVTVMPRALARDARTTLATSQSAGLAIVLDLWADDARLTQAFLGVAIVPRTLPRDAQTTLATSQSAALAIVLDLWADEARLAQAISGVAVVPRVLAADAQTTLAFSWSVER